MADDIVERPCAECKGTGVAEVIGGYERGCDACFGEGVQRFTTMEAGLLDQCEALEADNARLRSALKERGEGYGVEYWKRRLLAVVEQRDRLQAAREQMFEALDWAANSDPELVEQIKDRALTQ